MLKLRSLFLLAAFILYPGLIQAQIAFYADLGSNQADSSSATSLSITTATTVPAGASIIVIAVSVGAFTAGTANVACSDGANTYSLDTGLSGPGFTNFASISSTRRIASQLNAGSTITCTWAGGAAPPWNQRLRAFAVTGLASAPADGSIAKHGTGTSPTSGTATTTQANELLVGAITDESATVAGALFSPGTNGTAHNCAPTPTPTYFGLTGVGSSTSPSLFGMYCIVSAIGTYSASGSFGSGGSPTWGAVLATYIGAPPATHFAVSAPASAAAGTAFSFTVTALDQFNNTATGYGGSVHFTSSDGAATLPANSTLTNGVGTFSATLRTVGNQTLTATDTVTSSITGTSNTVAVSAVTSFSAPSATGTGTITASFTGGGAACTFASAQFIRVTGDPASPPAGTAPPGVAFPHGLFDFTTTGCTPGSTITMTITYPAVLAPGTQYWKYGPRPGPIAAGWYVLPATIGATTITFLITDGLLGDDDLLPNGTIVDQGGPGFSITPIPTLSQWMLVLLALMMLGFAMRHLSRRRG